MAKKHASPQSVDLLQNLKLQLKLTDGEIADNVGISRCYVNMMLNHRVPMPTKHYTRIDDYLYSVEQQ